MALNQRLVLVLLHGLRDEDLGPRTLPLLNKKAGAGLVLRRLLLESCDCPESEILTGRRPAEAGFAFEVARRAPEDLNAWLSARLTLWRWLQRLVPEDLSRRLAHLVTGIRPEGMAGAREDLLRHFRRSDWPPRLPQAATVHSPLSLAAAVAAAGGAVDLSGLALRGTDDSRVARLLDGGELPMTTLTVTSLRDAAVEADRQGIGSPEFKAAVQRTEAHLAGIIKACEATEGAAGLLVAAVRARIPVERRIDAATLIRDKAAREGLREGLDFLLLTEPRFARIWDLHGEGSRLAPLAETFHCPPLSEHGRVHTAQTPIPGMAAVGSAHGDIVFAAAPGVVLEPNDRTRSALQAVQASSLKPDQPAGFAVLWSEQANQGSFFEEVRGADLAVTIAGLLGTEPLPRSPGRSLLPPVRRPRNQEGNQDGTPPPFLERERMQPGVSSVRNAICTESPRVED